VPVENGHQENTPPIPTKIMNRIADSTSAQPGLPGSRD